MKPGVCLCALFCVCCLATAALGQAPIAIDSFEAPELRGWNGKAVRWDPAQRRGVPDERSRLLLSLNRDGEHGAGMSIAYEPAPGVADAYADLTRRCPSPPGMDTDTLSFSLYKASEKPCQLRITLIDTSVPEWAGIGYATDLAFAGRREFALHKALFTANPAFAWPRIGLIEIVLINGAFDGVLSDLRFTGSRTVPAKPSPDAASLPPDAAVADFAADRTNGLEVVPRPGAVTEMVPNLSGRRCLAFTPSGDDIRDDGLSFRATGGDPALFPRRALLMAEYLDSGTHGLCVRYVNRKGEPRDCRSVAKTGDRQWKRLVVEIADLAPDGGGDGKRAFTLDAPAWAGRWSHDKLYISRVALKGLTPEEERILAATESGISDLAAKYGGILVGYARLQAAARQLGRLAGLERALAPQSEAARETARAVAEKIGLLRGCYEEIYRNFRYRLMLGRHQETSHALQQARSLEGELTKLLDRRGAWEKRIAGKTPGVVRLPPALPMPGGVVTRSDFGKRVLIGAMNLYDGYDPRSYRALGLDFLMPSYGNQMVYPPTHSRPDGTVDFSDADRTMAAYTGSGGKLAVRPELMTFCAMNLPAWFQAKYGDAIRLQSASGYVDRASGDIWHPAVRQFARAFYTAVGEHYRTHPGVLAYPIANEAYLALAPPGSMTGTTLAGCGDGARAAFSGTLRKRYGTIAALNTRWRTQYPAFESVTPPTGEPRRTPLHYEFARFLDDSWIDFHLEGLAALRQADAVHAIHHKAVNAIQRCRFEEPWDLFATHAGSGISGSMHDFISCTPLAYSLNRYSKAPGAFRTIINDETWWAMDESLAESDPAVLAAALERCLWQGAAWGCSVFDLFLLYGDSDGWGCNILEKELDYTAIRPAVAALPTLKETLNRFVRLFQQTPVSHDGIALLIPTTECLYQSLAAKGPASNAAGLRLYNWLAREHLEALFLPEEALLNGREDLSRYKVLILPSAVSLPDPVAEKVARWVERGGYLVLSEPAGVYDEMGLGSNLLMRRTFGAADAPVPEAATTVSFRGEEWKLPGDTPTWRLAEGRNTGKVIATGQQREPLVLTRPSGKGKVLLFGFDVSQVGGFRQLLTDFVTEGITNPGVYSPMEEVELVLRRVPQTGCYLTVVNLNARRSAACPIVVNGTFPRVFDLTTGGGMPVKSDVIAGMTAFTLDLLPGEGRQLTLGQAAKAHRTPPKGAVARLGLLLRLNVLAAEAARRGSPLRDAALWAKSEVDAIRAGKPGAPRERILKLLAQVEETAAGRKDQQLLARAADLRRQVDGAGDDGVRAARLGVLLRSTEVAVEKRRPDLAERYLGIAENAAHSRKVIERSEPIDIEVARTRSPIQVDGDLSEWADAWQGRLKLSVDGKEEARFGLRRDGRALYLAVRVTDGEVGNHQETQIWLGDCVELFLNVLDDMGLPRQQGAGVGIPEAVYGPDDFQFLFGVNGRQIAGSSNPFLDSGGAFSRLDLPFAVRPTAGGYDMEVAVPWSYVHLAPVAGYSVGFDIAVDDHDQLRNTHEQLVWKGSKDNFRNTSGWGRMRLIDRRAIR